MAKLTLTQTQPKLRWPLLIVLLAGVVLAALGISRLLASGALFKSPTASVPAMAFAAPGKLPAVPMNTDIETTWGIRPKMAAVTADGGMIDFRYIVLDSDKANDMWGKLETIPHFITADGQEVALSELPGHKHDLVVGGTYYVLYPNSRNAMKSGEVVTLVVGDLKMDIPVY